MTTPAPLMAEELERLYFRLGMVNKMAKEQTEEFYKHYEFYSISFMMNQARLIKQRIGEIMDQITKLERGGV